MEQISSDSATFLCKKWLPLTPLLFFILISFVTSGRMWRWDLESARDLVVAVIIGGCLSALFRFLVSGFVDRVWMSDSQIRFQTAGRQETTSLKNVEELKSYFVPVNYPAHRQYFLSLRFAEPVGSRQQIRFWIQSPLVGAESPREKLDQLLDRIQAASDTK
ncbi:hypothetical protein [Gimesia panareensis]|uniref:hypothetical protein n=1 Tax=Gimesia panareensis TaxID=2527978 RepID=UPI0011A3ECFD|nr:hypothetical protein [Gimesia panareensis]